MIDAIPRWKQLGVRVRHQTGERDFERIESAYKQAGFPASVSRFNDDMSAAFAEAALIVCRSGASTVGVTAGTPKRP